jgi:hypothetical protein
MALGEPNLNGASFFNGDPVDVQQYSNCGTSVTDFNTTYTNVFTNIKCSSHVLDPTDIDWNWGDPIGRCTSCGDSILLTAASIGVALSRLKCLLADSVVGDGSKKALLELAEIKDYVTAQRSILDQIDHLLGLAAKMCDE